MSFNNDVQQPTVQGLVTLFKLDARKLGAGVLCFHGHNDGVISFKGEDYTPIPIHADGLEVRGDGKASTPTLSIANNINGVQGALSVMCQMYDDFAGAKLTVTQTLAQYLNSNDDSNFKTQTWHIEQKTADNPQTAVSFELSNPVDFGGAKIPVRQITGYCNWAVCGRYRGDECGYIGTARYTADGKPTDNPLLDVCGGRLSDCQLRFGKDNQLPFGGFPASNLA